MAGKKGRSGRKSKAFIERCITLLGDENLWKKAREKHPMHVLELAAKYSHSPAPQQHQVDAVVTFKAVRE